VLNCPQLGQRPMYAGDCFPQLEQIYLLRVLAIVRILNVCAVYTAIIPRGEGEMTPLLPAPTANPRTPHPEPSGRGVPPP
jgi:hypothetical protein